MNFVVGQERLHLIDNVFRVFWANALQQKNGGFVMRAAKILQREKWNEQTRSLAMFDDAGDMPVMIEKIKCVADFDFFRLRSEIVHEQVVGAFHVFAGKEDKSARNGAEAVAVDAVDQVYSAGRTELEKNGRNGLNVF